MPSRVRSSINTSSSRKSSSHSALPIPTRAWGISGVTSTAVAAASHSGKSASSAITTPRESVSPLRFGRQASTTTASMGTVISSAGQPPTTSSAA